MLRVEIIWGKRDAEAAKIGWEIKNMFWKHCAVCIILTAGLVLGSGCGQARGGREELEISGMAETSEAAEDVSGKETEDGEERENREPGAVLESRGLKGQWGAGDENRDGADAPLGQDNGKIGDMKKQFGENCIGEQTFEVELSEYNGAVWFVPYAPGQGNGDFHMQLIQNGNVLAEINPYVPENLAGESFTSLDAVSFYDINFDGNTDILLIETYGSTAFAAVYYGFDRDGEDYERNFAVQEYLSRQISDQAEDLTIPGIRKVLGDTRKNGKFAGYQEAYRAVGRLWEQSDDNVTYGLIYFDGDETPELAAGVDGFYVSLYTYSDGKACTLMDRWPYGAMGNAGYEYAPKKNSLRNYNSDYAGAIMYTTYMVMNELPSLETVAEIKTVNFDDANGNGVPDEDETGSIGYYGVSYLNGKEVSDAECAAYDAGEYEMIRGTMDLQGLERELGDR